MLPLLLLAGLRPKIIRVPEGYVSGGRVLVPYEAVARERPGRGRKGKT